MKVTRRGFLKVLPSVVLLPKALSPTKRAQAVEPAVTDLIQVNKLDANTRVFSAADSVQWFRYTSPAVKAKTFAIDDKMWNEIWTMPNRELS